MAIGDMIVIGVVIFFMILGSLGAFKWILNILAGAICGLLIIVGITLLVDNAQFNKLSSGIFKDGVIVPQIKKHIEPIQNCFGQSNLSDDVEVSTCDRNEDSIVARLIAKNVDKHKK